jgi:hypothetical protein
MKHKTDELEGAMLDAAVAMAEAWTFHRNKHDGITVNRPDGSRDEVGNYPPKFDAGTGHALAPVSIAAVMETGSFFPSTDWAQGGPIIERERMHVSPNFVQGDYYGHWKAIVFGFADQGNRADALGDSPLRAAMRAYVVSKFGDEVELP